MITRAFVLSLLPTIAAADTVTIGGYLETYYELAFRAPSNHVTNLRGFDDHERTFTLSNVALDVKGERGPLTAHIVLQYGAIPATDLWKYVQQATLAYASGKTVVDAGLFLSPIGPEALAIKDNWNWSRSNLFFGLPAYHTGARIAYQLGGGWTGMLHVYNGWNSVVDNNDYPSIALSASYAGKRLSGQVLYFGGIERPTGAPEGNAWRHLVDAYATLVATEDVSIVAQVDGGFERNDFGTSHWLAGALAAKVQLAPKLYAAARGDYFREHVPGMASPIFWPTAWIASATATLALQPVDGLSVRLELRHDHAKDRVFFGGDVMGDGMTTPYVPNRRAQDTVTLGAVAWF